VPYLEIGLFFFILDTCRDTHIHFKKKKKFTMIFSRSVALIVLFSTSDGFSPSIFTGHHHHYHHHRITTLQAVSIEGKFYCTGSRSKNSVVFLTVVRSFVRHSHPKANTCREYCTAQIEERTHP